MKKIIVLLLVVCCLFTAVSCDKEDGSGALDDIKDVFGKEEPTDSNLLKFNDMFASSAPTKAETVVSQKFNNNVELKSKFVLTTGTVDGKIATTLVSEIQTLSDIAGGTLNHISTNTSYNWYYEGMGTSTDRGRNWNAEGKDFAPKSGTLEMDLRDEYIADMSYTSDNASETLVIFVEAENTSKVLANFLGDEALEYDVKITVVAAGERITSVLIEYVIDEHLLGDDGSIVEISDTEVAIEVNYSYDIQAVTLE